MESPVKIWRNQKKTAALLAKTGVLVSWTVIRVPPSGIESQAPYPVGIVKFTSGGMMTCQIVDWDNEHLRINQPMEFVLRRVREPSTEGIIPYGIKARPIDRKAI
jgi:hypothetical protein